MYCIYCGQQLPDEANYCWKCGKAVVTAAKHQSSSPPMQFPSPLLSAIREPSSPYGYNLILVECGPKKIEVIKVLRMMTNWGVAEAKNCADTPNSVVLRGVSLQEAEHGRNKLNDVGANTRIE